MCRAALPDLVTGARHRHKSWKFDVEVQVATDGSAEAVNILNSNGPIAVTRWVKALAKEAQYRPALNDLGEPVPGTYRFTQAFDGTNQTQPHWLRVGTEPNCHARAPCFAVVRVHQVSGTMPFVQRFPIFLFERCSGSNAFVALTRSQHQCPPAETRLT